MQRLGDCVTLLSIHFNDDDDDDDGNDDDDGDNDDNDDDVSLYCYINEWMVVTDDERE